jgi:hypothetical protein
MQRHYTVKCPRCRAKYIPKLTLLLVPAGGRHTIPPDYIIPDLAGPGYLVEAFPTGDMGFWKQGGCVHEVVTVVEVEEEMSK